MTFEEVRGLGRNIRVHGNGFIQVDLADGGTRRLHVFGHPAVPRQVVPTPIHDHTFGFRSVVQSGRLVNVMYAIEKGAAVNDTSHYVCSVNVRDREDTALHPTGVKVSLRVVSAQVMLPRQEYYVRPGEFHETLANEPTVTIMEKLRLTPTPSPRVLCALGQEPDNSFHRFGFSEDDLWEFVREAMEWGRAQAQA